MSADTYDIAASVMDVADEEVKQALIEEFKGNQAALMAASQSFVVKTQDIATKLLNTNRKLKLMHQIKSQLAKDENSDVSSLERDLAEYSAYDVAESELQKFMTEVFSYQQILNAYLGQEVRVVYVHQKRNGEPVLYELHDTGDEMKKDIASRGGGISARYKAPAADRMIEKAQRKFNIAGLDSAYATTVKRGKYSKKFLKTNSYLILWKPQSSWKKMFISSLGDVNESYAAFYLRNDPHPSFLQGDIEELVDDFLTSSPSGVQYVDNVSGLLTGDVTVGNVEYAIKSKGATALSYKQVLNIAAELAEGNFDVFDRELEKINEQIKDSKGTRNNAEALELDDIFDNEILKDSFKDTGYSYGSMASGMLGITVDFRQKI